MNFQTLLLRFDLLFCSNKLRRHTQYSPADTHIYKQGVQVYAQFFSIFFIMKVFKNMFYILVYVLCISDCPIKCVHLIMGSGYLIFEVVDFLIENIKKPVLISKHEFQFAWD